MRDGSQRQRSRFQPGVSDASSTSARAICGLPVVDPYSKSPTALHRWSHAPPCQMTGERLDCLTPGPPLHDVPAAVGTQGVSAPRSLEQRGYCAAECIRLPLGQQSGPVVNHTLRNPASSTPTTGVAHAMELERHQPEGFANRSIGGQDRMRIQLSKLVIQHAPAGRDLRCTARPEQADRRAPEGLKVAGDQEARAQPRFDRAQ